MSQNSSLVVTPAQEALIAGRVQQVMSLPAVAAILGRIRSELGAHFVYHSIDHTEGVIEEAIRFATLDHRADRECLLVGIAAAFHDAGFLVDPAHHEQEGAELCRVALTEHGGFSADEIKTVERMILDTRLELEKNRLHRPLTTPLSPYLLDADLANLGRQDFFPSLERVREELAALGAGPRYEPIELLDLHEWHSRPARELRDEQKQANRRLLLSERPGGR